MYLGFRPRNCFNGLPPINDDACVRWVEQMMDTGVNLIAISCEQGMVGHTALFPMGERTCETIVVVLPEHQQAGIGSQLARCGVQLSYELGFEKIWLCVEARNQVARHVYSRCGFRYVAHAAMDELEMTFDLSGYYQAMNVPVSEVMNRQVISIRQDISCRRAIGFFLKNHVASLPVTNTEGQVIGIISETDLISPASLGQKVNDVLTREVVTLREASLLGAAVRLFQSKGLRYIPVIDADRRLIGVVGRRDILAYYMKVLDPAGE